jgi:dCTP deaminase
MAILSDKTIRDLCTGACRYEKVLERYPSSNARESNPVEFVIDEIPQSFNSLQGESVRIDPHTVIDNHGKPMIDPFEPALVRSMSTGRRRTDNVKVISYGLSSYGYDVRLKAEAIKIFTNANGGIVDPMNPNEECFINGAIHETDRSLKYFILPPNSYALASTIEYFRIPRNVSVVCLGKSTYARSCAIVNVTPIEAGFEGEVVIEISNGSTLPVMIYLESGIAQFQFFRGDEECEKSYADGNRKYQGQRGVTLSKV